jgi:hypothetical protein
MKTLTNKQRIKTAHHEAAHAVVANEFDYPIRRIILYDPPKDDGLRGIVEMSTYHYANEDVLVSVAGIVAESVLDGRKTPYKLTLPNLLSRFSQDDMKEFKRLFCDIHEVEVDVLFTHEGDAMYEAYFDYVCIRVQNKFLLPNWEKVQRIANAVLESGEIGGDELQELLRRKAMAA